MTISKSFQGFFFGQIIDDVFKNYGQIKIPEYKWEDGSSVILIKYEDYTDADKLRYFLKIFDSNFPKLEDGEPLSMRYMENKAVVEHIEYIRYVLSENGAWLKEDEAEWNRLIEQYNRG